MALCEKCGAQVRDDAQACPVCGQPIGAPVQQQQYQQPQQQAYQQPQQVNQQQPQQQYQQPQQQIYQQPGGYYQQQAAPQSAASDAQANKTMGILSYLFFLVPLLTGAHKNSPFVKFHLNQGIVLVIASAALSIIFNILSRIVVAIVSATYAIGAGVALVTILSIVSWVAYLAVFALAVIGIVNAAGGNMKPLPVIGKITILK